MITTLIFTLFLLILLWISVTYYRALKIKGKLPGPTLYPFFLNDLTILTSPTDSSMVEESYKKYGDTFIIISNFFVVVFTVDPKNIQHVTSEHHNFNNYKRSLRKGLIYEVGRILFGDGIFFTDGVVWEIQRAHSKPMFKIENLIEMIPVFDRKSNQVIEQIKSLNLKEPVDIQDLFMRFTLESFCEIGFGVSLNLISHGAEFPRWFDTVQRIIVEIVRSPFTRFFKMNDYRNLVSQLDKVVYDIIDQKKKI